MRQFVALTASGTDMAEASGTNSGVNGTQPKGSVRIVFVLYLLRATTATRCMDPAGRPGWHAAPLATVPYLCSYSLASRPIDVAPLSRLCPTSWWLACVCKCSQSQAPARLCDTQSFLLRLVHCPCLCLQGTGCTWLDPYNSPCEYEEYNKLLASGLENRGNPTELGGCKCR
jgi:hypothetical protein